MTASTTLKQGQGNLPHFICSRTTAGKEGTMRNWTKWVKAAGIRAMKTAAQTAVALLPATAMISDVDWKVVAGTAALAAIASMLTSLAGIPEEELE